MANGFVDGVAATKLHLPFRRLTVARLICQVPFVREAGNSSWAFLISGKGCDPNILPTSISHTQQTHPRSRPLARPRCVPRRHGIAETCTCMTRTATVPV